MGHFYQPPPPFFGGSQPYAPRELDPIIVASGDNPPIPTPETFWASYVSWLIDPPVRQRGPSAALPGWSVDSPPIPTPETFWASYAGWQVGDPPIFRPVRLVLVNEAPPPADAPPGNVPGNFWAVYRSWLPPDPMPRQAGAITAGIFTTQVNSPPVSTRRVTDPIRWQWEPPDPPPVQKGPLSPGVPGQSVDRPPVSTRRVIEPTLRRSWEPPDPPPVQKGPLSAGVPGQSVDRPPVTNRPRIVPTLVRSWEPPDPLPVQKGPQAAGTPGWSVDRPLPWSPSKRPQFSLVVRTWQPPDPPPVQKGPQVAGTPGWSVDRPPISGLSRSPLFPPIRWTWEPPDPLPVQKGPLNPRAYLTDLPPTFSWTNFVTIDAIWRIPPQVHRPVFYVPQTAFPIDPCYALVAETDLYALVAETETWALAPIGCCDDMLDFPEKRTAERKFATVDLGPKFAAAVVLSAPLVTPTVIDGVDPDPGAILSGQPLLVGTIVGQWLVGGIDGVTYVLNFAAAGSDGSIASQNARLPVKDLS